MVRYRKPLAWGLRGLSILAMFAATWVVLQTLLAVVPRFFVPVVTDLYYYLLEAGVVLSAAAILLGVSGLYVAERLAPADTPSLAQRVKVGMTVGVELAAWLFLARTMAAVFQLIAAGADLTVALLTILYGALPGLCIIGACHLTRRQVRLASPMASGVPGQ